MYLHILLAWEFGCQMYTFQLSWSCSPKGIMGQLFWLAFSEQGKWEMLIKYNGESSILIGWPWVCSEGQLSWFQHETEYFLPYLDKNWQFLKFHAGIFMFGSQTLVPKVCETLKVVLHLAITLWGGGMRSYKFTLH
jgi:hypothetical protein